MVNRIRFVPIDAWLLYCIPRPGADLATIVRHYQFVNRAAAPSRKELEGCLSRALSVGILEKQGSWFKVQAGWYERIHFADATAENEVEAMLGFESLLLVAEWDAQNAIDYVIENAEYEKAIAASGLN